MWEEQDDKKANGSLSINPKFAKKYEHNKRREALDKAKSKYGKDLEGKGNKKNRTINLFQKC